MVLKTLLAIKKLDVARPLHLVAELLDERTEPVARMVAGQRAALIATSPLISRLLVQTGRQSGLSAVYGELLDFAGVEIYFQTEPRLVGTTFRDAVFRYDTSTLIGVFTGNGELELPPGPGRRFEAGDQVIAISEDDDRVVLDGVTGPDDALIADIAGPRPRSAERTLILGNSPRLPLILRELDAYVADGSHTLVAGEGDPAPLLAGLDGGLRHMVVATRSGDLTDRDVLESLEVSSFDHVLVLSETAGRTQAMADARTTVVLLYLRAIMQAGGKVPVTSEILELANRDLTTSDEADDFIVSNRLVSLVVSQVAENAHLIGVFDELLGAAGHGLHVKPATDYVRPCEVTFATVCGAALRRDEIAIGYRLAVHATDPDRAFGVVVSPRKSSRVTLGPQDKVIVLALG
jgi:K+/H+ antiporter YhaU regulatory subunit KhtT